MLKSQRRIITILRNRQKSVIIPLISMSYPRIPFKTSEITIQPQAKLCMQKLHITEEEVLTTINECESGDIEATTPTEANTLAAFPKTAEEIPAFYSSERTFPERNSVIEVKYSTTIKKQQG